MAKEKKKKKSRHEGKVLHIKGTNTLKLSLLLIFASIIIITPRPSHANHPVLNSVYLFPSSDLPANGII
jgi:hypothetical protein